MKTKTTFELDSSLLTQLKTTAARAGKSVRDLLTEGAEGVIEKYQNLGDREELRRRSKLARLKFVGGFRGANNLASNHDQVIYGVAERPVEYSAEPARRRRKK